MNKIEGLARIGSDDGVPLSHIMRYHADRDPNRPCLTMNGVSISRGEFDRRTNRLARAYASRGVGPGDFVTIALPNSIAFFEACFAVWKCGGIPNPMPAKAPLPDLQASLDLSQPRLLVGGSAELRVASYIPEGFEAGPEFSDEPLDPVVSPYWKTLGSGGSTGRPKLIVFHSQAKFSPTTCYLGQRLDGTALNPGPLYHNAAFSSSMFALFAGNHVVVMPRFDAEEMLRLIERYRVNSTVIVPTMMNRIWRLEDAVRLKYDIGSLEIVLHQASFCPAWLKQEWIDWLGAEKIVEAYGASEGQGSTVIAGPEWLEHKGSVGRAQPGSSLLILDPEGSPLPPGEVGEIYFVPDDPNRTTYHYLGAEPKKRGIAETPGDMGYVDDAGYLFLADRRTDMIVSGGANIFPAEVEAALDAHSDVRSSVVIGLPNDDLIASAHAIVDVAEDTDTAGLEDRLREFLKTRLAAYKVPRSFEFVHHPLRDDAGKVRRMQLREERLACAA